MRLHVRLRVIIWMIFDDIYNLTFYTHIVIFTVETSSVVTLNIICLKNLNGVSLRL